MRFIFLLITGILFFGKFAAAQVSQGGIPIETTLLKSAGTPMIEIFRRRKMESGLISVQAGRSGK